MKKIELILIFTLICGSLFSQSDFTQPNYEEIRKEISRPDSRFYYPELYSKYVENDTTLDREDYVHLYFGFIYNSKYEPYGNSDLKKKVDYYAKRPEKQLTTSDIDSLFKYTKLMLETNPFNIRDLNKLIYYYHKNGDTDNENKYLYKAKMIIETILASGDGKTKSTAFHVISPGHEYDILGAIGFEPITQKLVGQYYDYIKVRRNKAKIKGIYFNITKVFESQITYNKHITVANNGL
ncbi:DUF4919 domain-containing protein [Carboxylicivirga marina]|uniref:DUF4919 domain-containing protein n=1 Tax=Carboxylicivirga marina TaxID=2800988 RepID=UPI002595728C|nr:DUF4919 domain-containing protein [uncultured Carboxylicivirga sp.]